MADSTTAHVPPVDIRPIVRPVSKSWQYVPSIAISGILVGLLIVVVIMFDWWDVEVDTCTEPSNYVYNGYRYRSGYNGRSRCIPGKSNSSIGIMVVGGIFVLIGFIAGYQIWFNKVCSFAENKPHCDDLKRVQGQENAIRRQMRYNSAYGL